MITNMSLLCLIAVLGFASVHGQPFGVEPMQFETDSLEAAKRKEDNYTGFVFDFDTEPVSHSWTSSCPHVHSHPLSILDPEVS